MEVCIGMYRYTVPITYDYDHILLSYVLCIRYDMYEKNKEIYIGIQNPYYNQYPMYPSDFLLLQGVSKNSSHFVICQFLRSLYNNSKLGQRQSQTPFSSAFWVKKSNGSKKIVRQKNLGSEKFEFKNNFGSDILYRLNLTWVELFRGIYSSTQSYILPQ